MYLKEGFWRFSDGFFLKPGLGVGKTKMQAPWSVYLSQSDQDMPLDQLHADVVAFEGRVSLDFDAHEYSKKLDLGEKGKRTSVAEFMASVDEWCKEYLAAHPEHEVESLGENCYEWTEKGHDRESDSVLWTLS